MIKSLEKKYTVMPSLSSAHEEMGLFNIVNFFQDIVTEHSRLIGIDTPAMRISSDGFWAVTKHKIKIHRTPHLYETVTAVTWPGKPGPVRGDRNFKITDDNGRTLIESRSEWVILDSNTHHVKKLSDTLYPYFDEHIPEKVLPEPFLRIRESVSEDNFVYTHAVKTSDIDLSQHTNNAVYVRLFEDCFPLKFYDNYRITGIELNYIHESRFGDEIMLYKKEVSDGYYLQASSPSGEIFAACIIETQKR